MEVERDTISVGEFEFECGESIPDLEVAYEAYGEFTGENAVLVCHALTGSSHVAGHRTGKDTSGQARAWWDDIVGPGKAIDTTEYYVVCANVPGSCYGTTGPASENPETGEPYGTDFPAVTVGDWTEAQRRLLDELGIPALHAVVGGSVGGMNALDWAKRHPDHVERVVSIAAAARLDPQCLALDAVARRAITTDDAWQGGDYYDTDDEPTDGLALARQIGHIMYLSKASMEQKFGRRAAGRDAMRTFPVDPAGTFFPYRDVESYLDYQAEKFVERFDANAYLYLTRSMDNYDLAAGFEDDADALSAFEGEALLMSFTGDWHFTTEQSEQVAEAFRDLDTPVAHHVIESDHGHDAFLVEPEKVGPPLADFLDSGVDGKAITDTAEDDEPESQFAPVHTSLFS
ncbi:homoserine O-acetyltransferase MetX [Halorientalis regularis]|jgi:homoserine O-acetyltransferase|uniref:Homoserine O-acetyltransferase n=1 Tax=Halorientalis regularis TaxID=660518 RepID=A0A1G7K5S1_9EURY|nr:homoserine O-acetyltransferase [Halorientalis regularis]SDF32482.1 homoserine O-acetyltransferase [Halorientalis regularis]